MAPALKIALFVFGLLVIIGLIVFIILYFGTSTFEASDSIKNDKVDNKDSAEVTPTDVKTTGQNPPGDNSTLAPTTDKLINKEIIVKTTNYSEINAVWFKYLHCIDRQNHLKKEMNCVMPSNSPEPIHPDILDYITCVKNNVTNLNYHCKQPTLSPTPGMTMENTFMTGANMGTMSNDVADTGQNPPGDNSTLAPTTDKLINKEIIVKTTNYSEINAVWFKYLHCIDRQNHLKKEMNCVMPSNSPEPIHPDILDYITCVKNNVTNLNYHCKQPTLSTKPGMTMENTFLTGANMGTMSNDVADTGQNPPGDNSFSTVKNEQVPVRQKFLAVIGKSDSVSKTVDVDGFNVTCPSYVNLFNWEVNTDHEVENFEIKVDGSKVTAIRNDGNDGNKGWDLDLAFYCVSDG